MPQSYVVVALLHCFSARPVSDITLVCNINPCYILTSIKNNIRDLKYGLISVCCFVKDIARIRENYDPCNATERRS